ncbi:MAG: GNAT family N-acetyltransferase [Methylocystis sp.]
MLQRGYESGIRRYAREASSIGHVHVLARSQLARSARWKNAFDGTRKDHRYYELVEDTLPLGFDYRYFAIANPRGEVFAIQPFFLLQQDLLAGVSGWPNALAGAIRWLIPRFMYARTLMIGCVAGEGHLDGDETARRASAPLLASAVKARARDLGATLIVLKEFPTKYRCALESFLDRGFVRLPSMPLTCLDISYRSFDDYMTRGLAGPARRSLRRNLAIADRHPIEMQVIVDISPIINEIYPLYLAVYERSTLHFEKLTKEYFCRIGALMPDRTRFFIWRKEGKIVAFSLCMLDGDGVWAEYLGLDYEVALDIRLYFRAYRDVVTWAMANGYKRFHETGLHYDPKRQLGHLLEPLDLYVRHTSWPLNVLLRWALPLLDPTRYDRTLRKFPNYSEL